jgi:phosphopantothenoylcysteine decarboxylase / phosphopantothenate---cysteine ligase
MTTLSKNICLGVTGGIAAYKSAELIRGLRKAGCEVRVVMTEGAKAFITPLTLQALSGYPIYDSLLDTKAEAAMGHIELARWADCVLVAPASANVIARLTHGIADDLLTTLCLATKAPIVLAPAMNQQMWAASATQDNLAALAARGVMQLGPASGEQACGDVGLGRMLEPAQIIEALSQQFNQGVLAGKTVLVTAGPTREAIDPFRFLTNYSSGKMGYALAAAAADAGATVICVSGPVSLPAPKGVEVVSATSAADMYEHVMERIAGVDIFIGAAAVSDYTVPTPSTRKLKKSDADLQLSLTRTQDILKAVASLEQGRPYTIGFAAETDDVLTYARQKLVDKNLDMIIANEVCGAQKGFAQDRSEVTLITATATQALPAASKHELARQIIAHIS